MSGPGAAWGDSGRAAELRLARLHVRSGVYALARAELEALAGDDRLDREAILDLAEVRWRTGDLPGAAAAASAWLEEAVDETGPPAVLAHVICAEAAAERGRADVAEAHVEAAVAELGGRGALEAVLAGIVARAPWPWEAEAAPRPEVPPPVPVAPAAAAAEAAPLGVVGEAARGSPAGVPLAGPAAQLVRSGSALLRSAPERAAVLLALALRADRAAAEAVLAVLDHAGPAPAGPPREGAPADGGPEEGAPAGGQLEVGPPGAGAAADVAAVAPPAEADVAAVAPPAADREQAAQAYAAALAFVRAEALRAAGRHEEARIAYASAERLALAPAEPGPPGSPT